MADKPDFSELDKLRSVEELASRQGELKRELDDFDAEYKGLPFPPAVSEVVADKKGLWDEADKRIKELNARKLMLERMAGDERKVDRVDEDFFKSPRPSLKEQDIYDLSRNRKPQEWRDNAMRAVEITNFPHPKSDQDKIKAHISELLDTIDVENGPDGENKVLAKRILSTGSPAYRRAFGKTLAGVPLSPEEQRALSQTGASGGFAVTFDLDPTIVPTSNGQVNPFRAACRVVSITTNEWRGVSSGAVTATYRAEAAEVADNAPTLAQPAFIPKRADAFIPFSIEIGQDWGGLQSEMAKLIQDGKDSLEATEFAVGLGTGVLPEGITLGTNTFTTATTLVIAAADLYGWETDLAPRFRPNAVVFANRFIYNKIRAIDTSGGAQLWTENLRVGLANTPQGNTGYNLLGYPAYEASGMAASVATTTKMGVLGDPSYYVIVDRVGMNIELIPHLFATANNRPSGQRGLFAMWRNTARIFDSAGFSVLVGL